MLLDKRLLQRLPVGLGYLHPSGLPISSIPDAEPLDLLQADGACERLQWLLRRFVSVAPSRAWISPSLWSSDIEYPGCGATRLTEGCGSLQKTLEDLNKILII